MYCMIRADKHEESVPVSLPQSLYFCVQSTVVLVLHFTPSPHLFCFPVHDLVRQDDKQQHKRCYPLNEERTH